MRKGIIAAAVVAAFGAGGIAAADGLPTKYAAPVPAYVPVNSWSGFYFGANLGYGWNSGSGDIATFFDGDGTPTGFSGRGFESEGAFAGGQIGYNWQRNRFVFGIETDLQGAGIKSDARSLVDNGDFILNRHLHQSIDWFGTIRGRVGYGWDSTLVYFTGGFAYASVNSSVTDPIVGLPFAQFSRNEVETGFVIGGGLEYKINPSWSIKGEYQYIDLGSERLTGSALFGVIPIHSNEIDNSLHTVRIGVNYHIDNCCEYEPLK